MKKTTIMLFTAAASLIAISILFFIMPRAGHRDQEIIVLCGTSMRVPLEEIIRRYKKTSGNTVIATYGESSELCSQLLNVRKGDIFICHDPFMPWAEEQGMIHTWENVARLDIVLVVPKGNPKQIKGVEDLSRSGLKVGIGDQRYSTSGVIVNHLLKRMDTGKAIRKNIRMESKGHQGRAAAVIFGTLDAAVIWNAVAFLFRDKLDIIPIPKDRIDAVSSATYGKSDLRKINVSIGITILALNKEQVRDFWEFAAHEGKQVFSKYGFTPYAE